jgi:hypothetical protein
LSNWQYFFHLFESGLSRFYLIRAVDQFRVEQLICCQECRANDCRAIEFRAVHPHSEFRVVSNVVNELQFANVSFGKNPVFCYIHLLGGIELVEPEIFDKTWYELLLIKMLDLEMVNLLVLKCFLFEVKNCFRRLILSRFLVIQYFHNRTLQVLNA